ncbi:hypothetical protein BJ170DRAFT_611601 [Xylariales sp. AK1849]|nr:hypothetical protein BJ170DRAFT_611601 [Xylariales sp. AK1849]
MFLHFPNSNWWNPTRQAGRQFQASVPPLDCPVRWASAWIISTPLNCYPSEVPEQDSHRVMEGRRVHQLEEVDRMESPSSSQDLAGKLFPIREEKTYRALSDITSAPSNISPAPLNPAATASPITSYRPNPSRTGSTIVRIAIIIVPAFIILPAIGTYFYTRHRRRQGKAYKPLDQRPRCIVPEHAFHKDSLPLKTYRHHASVPIDLHEIPDIQSNGSEGSFVSIPTNTSGHCSSNSQGSNDELRQHLKSHLD